MLVQVPFFGRNSRGSPDFMAYPVPKACMHVLGTGVPRCLGVARSASSPKAAQALECSLTPGLSPRAHLVPSFILPELNIHLKMFKIKILKLDLIHSAFIFRSYWFQICGWVPAADAVPVCAAVSACRRNFLHGTFFHRKFVLRRIISLYDESSR